ncbi:hypothetical protein QC764_409500 [Podospora pseudoanserina]|uniref:Cation efflux protein cytoplasmic domain-containing protein n=1 Tax=Podospora pseudoanserina TaxID=2609844 RepID=A0ABR0I9Z9_9PEZI|nr:hypothetical protein QC764_409500 [Podospora pseudoanserina]
MVTGASPPENAPASTSPEIQSDAQPGAEPASTAAEKEVAIPAGPTRQATTTSLADPLDIARHRRENISQKQMKIEHPKGNKRRLKKYYAQQNALIDDFLGADDEEQVAIEKDAKYAPKIKFAIRGSFVINFCLFVIQLYAAISTGSLALFATTADAFMDLVSSFVMLIASWLAARPSVYKYPVGRTRIEAMAIILFCALMTTVAIQLLFIVFAKGSMMVYCLMYRRFPTVFIFYIDHRNDIAINSFGLIMAVVGEKIAWYLDPIGAILVALIILFSWVSNAFEHIWLLVGKSAPKEFISKLIYMGVTHDDRILKVDTCRAYHAGHKYFVEMDIVMDEGLPLKVTHDVGQDLQRKLEGLADVERAFVHVDYDHQHDVNEEHKPLFAPKSNVKRSLKDIILFRKPKMAASGDSSSETTATQ